jgi:hypothetical protein
VALLGDFRKKAEECLRWAQNARNPDEWLARLNMAQLWLRLAQKAEARDAALAPPDVTTTDGQQSAAAPDPPDPTEPPGPRS